jgi:uncharacterized protein
LRPQPSNTVRSSEIGSQGRIAPVVLPHHHEPIHWKIVWKRRLIIGSRWLHIYLSMVCFAVVLFFAVTGLTLNHPDWFAGQERAVQKGGALDPKWLKPKVNGPLIIQALRGRGGIKGSPSEITADDSQVTLSFKGPGYSADVFIDRDTGKFTLTETRMGVAAVLNDLHKGRDSGKIWGWLIDFSAVMLALISLTGLVILFFLAKRRVSGLAALAVGAVVCCLLFLMFVP